jgi:hypothetical protein
MKERDLTKIKIQGVLDSLENGASTIKSACIQNQLSRARFYVWMNKKGNREKVLNIIDRRNDDVEYSLFKNATENNNVTAQIFWLKNRDPDRWKDKVEHDGEIKILTNAQVVDRTCEIFGVEPDDESEAKPEG